MAQENKTNAPVQYAGIQRVQNTIVTAVNKNCDNMGCELTDYGKECVVSAFQGVVSFLNSRTIWDKELGKKRPMTIQDLDYGQFLLGLQSVGTLELNFGAIPSEIYFDLRGNNLTFKPQGAGNEKLIRKYGVGIAPNGLSSPWIVREGDEFELPSYDGLTSTAPKWKRKSLSAKVLFVVYPLKKADGSVEWLMADRESVKANLVAQIRQNALYAFYKKDKNGNFVLDNHGNKIVDEEAREKFYQKLNDDAESMSVDELLKSKEYDSYINPTYTSFGSKEAMIIRKMENNALKNYPREFNGYQKKAVETIYEDRDDSLITQNIQEADVVEKVEKEIEEKKPVENAIKGVQFDENGELVKEKKTPKVEEHHVEKPVEKPVEQPIEKPVEKPAEEVASVKEHDPYEKMF